MLFLRGLIIVIAIQLFIFAPKLSAQKLTFDQLGIRQGLPATEVYNLFQDKHGYVWAFTEYGIVKHNGTVFTPVCTNIPFKESAVYAVAESPGGDMYFGNSKANIYRIKNDSAIKIKGIENTTKEILANSEVLFSLVIDDSSNLYFSTFFNTYKFSKNKSSVKNISLDYSNKSTGFYFKEVGDDFFLIKLAGKKLKDSYFRILNNNDSIICESSYDRAWFEERAHIRQRHKDYYISTGSEIILTKNTGEIKRVKFDKTIINFEISPNGHIWVGLSYGGLYELDADLNKIEHYLNDIEVSDILFDDQLGIWVSTIGEGVYYCKNIYNLSYHNIPELLDCISLLKVVNKRLFIGTSKGNLYIKENSQIKKIDLKNNQSYINDIIDFRGNYYIGTRNNILMMDSSLQNIKPSATGYNGYSFSREKNDSLIIVSSSKILKISGPNDKYGTSHSALRPRYITGRFPNEFFISTKNGLYRLNDKFSIPPYLSELTDKKISQLKTDNKKNIWICTKGDGLYSLSKNNHLSKHLNTPSKVITDIAFIQDSIILLSTNKGAFVNSLNKLNTKSSWTLLLDEEILSIEVYNDKIFFATKQGLTTLDIKNLFNAFHQKFYLKSIIINGNEIHNNNIKLNYKENDIYFNFDFLAYSFPDKKIHYQLNGPSGSNGVSNGTQLHFQNLVPGYYTLYAHALINSVKSKENRIVTSFYIEPAFWQTNTFLIILVTCTLLFTFLITWYILYRIRKKEKMKSEVSKLLAEYSLTALKAQVNPHFISNSLSAIQQLIISNEVDTANQYITKFSLLIRYVLKYSDKSVANLTDEIKIIELNVELEQLRFNNQFVFQMDIDESIENEEIFIPPLITQPFIENAIWHGLLPLNNDRIPKLTLKIRIKNQNLIISVIDNGVGRTPIDLTVLKNSSDRESKGTYLIKSRIENLNHLYSSNEAMINIIDLKDGQENPIGTRVNIIFPLSMLNKLYDEKDKEYYY